MQLKHHFEVTVQETLHLIAYNKAHHDSLFMITYFQSVSALCRQGLLLSSEFPQHYDALPFLKDTDKHS